MRWKSAKQRRTRLCHHPSHPHSVLNSHKTKTLKKLIPVTSNKTWTKERKKARASRAARRITGTGSVPSNPLITIPKMPTAYGAAVAMAVAKREPQRVRKTPAGCTTFAPSKGYAWNSSSIFIFVPFLTSWLSSFCFLTVFLVGLVIRGKNVLTVLLNGAMIPMSRVIGRSLRRLSILSVSVLLECVKGRRQHHRTNTILFALY